MDDEGREEDERAFGRLHDVLLGARVPLDRRAAKVLRLLLDGDCDAEISPNAFGVHLGPTRSRYPYRHFLRTAPGVVAHLLAHAGAGPVRDPVVLAVPAGTIDDDAPWSHPTKRVWVVPGSDVVKLLVRTSPAPEEEPFTRPVPPDGPLALRELPALEPTYRELASPLACPRCGSSARRYRALGSALVCLRCHRSFDAP